MGDAPASRHLKIHGPDYAFSSGAYCRRRVSSANLAVMSDLTDHKHPSSAVRGRAGAVIVVVLAVVLAGATRWMSAPAAIDDGGQGVQVLSGGIHSVRHSVRPLPSADTPRPDGLPTLVQFAATWCEVCHAMEPVMANVRRATEGRLLLVEKDVDSDMDLVRRFHVRGTPTFVVLDAQGRELGRPGLILDPGRFLASIEQIMAGARG